MEVIGILKMIGHTQDVSPTFRKREIVVTTDEQYPQSIMIEFTQDRCNILDNFYVGEQVKVSINLRGREWTNPQGEVKYFNSIQGWQISLLHPQATNNGTYQQQGSAVDAYNQQQSYQQQSGYQTNQFPTTQQEDEKDDLPF